MIIKKQIKSLIIFKLERETKIVTIETAIFQKEVVFTAINLTTNLKKSLTATKLIKIMIGSVEISKRQDKMIQLNMIILRK